MKNNVEEVSISLKNIRIEKERVEGELEKERQTVITKLRLMEDMELKITEEKHLEINKIKQDFMAELENEKIKFND